MASDYVKKIIYIITLKLYLQIKANITSLLTARNLLSAELLFALTELIELIHTQAVHRGLADV